MNPISPELNTEDLKQQILDAAQERFMVYGYGKTTMAEIARDLSMSAANLYRYFENKQDIGAACAERCMGRRYEHLKELTRNKNLSAAERLRVFVVESFRYNLEMLCDQPKINELVEYVSSERQDMVYKKIDSLTSLIAEILAHGNESGEFDVDDVVATGRSVYAALILFDVPLFARLFPQQEFEALAGSVVDLLIKGLNKRN